MRTSIARARVRARPLSVLVYAHGPVLLSMHDRFPTVVHPAFHPTVYCNAFQLLARVHDCAFLLIHVPNRRTHQFHTGSAVAWAQRRFYGGYIEKGSWFSHLQRAGMTAGRWTGPTWKTIGGSILAGIGLAGGLFSGCGR